MPIPGKRHQNIEKYQQQNYAGYVVTVLNMHFKLLPLKVYCLQKLHNSPFIFAGSLA